MLTPFKKNNIVQSIESITSSMWSNGEATLDSFHNHSSNDFLINVSRVDGSPIEFSILYGSKSGHGSPTPLSETKINYLSYKNLILGNSEAEFNFGNGVVNNFFIINLQRSNYKEKIKLGSFELNHNHGGGISISDSDFKDNGHINTMAGKAYYLDDNNGLILPDIGIILIKDFITDPTLTPSAEILNDFFDGLVSITLTSEESISAIYLFSRIENQEYNYSKNPSFVNNDGTLINERFIQNPQTYITTIGFYNPNNELLAVAKLSQPIPKNFTTEALIKAKLVY